MLKLYAVIRLYFDLYWQWSMENKFYRNQGSFFQPFSCREAPKHYREFGRIKRLELDTL